MVTFGGVKQHIVQHITNIFVCVHRCTNQYTECTFWHFMYVFYIYCESPKEYMCSQNVINYLLLFSFSSYNKYPVGQAIHYVTWLLYTWLHNTEQARGDVRNILKVIRTVNTLFTIRIKQLYFTLISRVNFQDKLFEHMNHHLWSICTRMERML